MRQSLAFAGRLSAAIAGLAVLLAGAAPQAQPVSTALPTGQAITPMAARGARFETLNPDLPTRPDFLAGQAAALALSPDSRTLLVLPSGYNLNADAKGKPIPEESREYVFVYDVTGPAPVKTQVIKVPNTFLGIAWAPDGRRFYVSGGVDDVVREYAGAPGAFAESRVFPLGHKAGNGRNVPPGSAGLAVSPDGARLLVANFQNDSVSLIDLKAGNVTGEQDLRPGSAQAGGTYPRAVIWVSDTRAYVTSQRDRELIVLTAAPALRIAARIKTVGQPVGLATNAARTRLYAALDNTDGVAVVDPARGRILQTIPTTTPKAVWPNPAALGGANSVALTLSPDARTLLVANAGENAIAVVRLGERAAGLKPGKRRTTSEVVGLIPTGWYPTGVAVRPDGQLFVINAKSPSTPNPGACRKSTGAVEDPPCTANNQYIWQLEKAGLLSLPMPTPGELGQLTRQVAVNDRFPGSAPPPGEAKTMAFLRAHIRHVIYVVKENRSYDQVLGDLGRGNGDPRLTLLPDAISPNHHDLARRFVTLDAFFASGESSNTGWNWTTAARANDYAERAAPVNYANRGLQYDHEGTNRSINVGYATLAERQAANPLTPDDPNLVAGTADVAAPDGPGGEAGRGYLWDSALRAGKSVRNYGFYGDLGRYSIPQGSPGAIPLEREPFKAGLTVFYPTKAALQAVSDPHFRAFDQSFPDYWRFKEWEREFDGYVAAGKLPDLSLVRMPHDHFGNFARAIDGVNTVETQMADNDYALGLMVAKLAASPFAADTLIFVIEDDAQDGADHVDAHRTLAYVIGPYVKQGAVVSTRYTTVNMLRTMEMVLGLKAMGLNDGLAAPMADVFDITATAAWSYTPRVPAILRTTGLPLPPPAQAVAPSHPTHSAAWWEAAMAGQNFAEEDRLDTVRFNRALWRGLKGGAPPAGLGRRARDDDDDEDEDEDGD
ncbi:hypothetical protein BH11PSE2_BH11PSE2_16070 [soil metagenome]